MDTFTNTATGTISGGPGAVLLGSSVGAFTNSGTLTGGGTGVTILGSVDTFTNTTTGVMSGGPGALYVDGTVGDFLNAGVLDASGTAVVLGGAGTVNNSGTISGDAGGIHILGSVASFSNSGTISADYGTPVNLDAVDSFTNSGTIHSNSNRAVYLNSSPSFVNSGVISGLGGVVIGGNVPGLVDITNSGTIEGYVGVAIDFGTWGSEARDDFLRLLPGSQITGAVWFGPGFDTLDLRNYQGNATLSVASLEQILGGAGPIWDDSQDTGTIQVVDDTAIKFAASGNFSQLAGSLSNYIGGARNGATFGGAASGPLNYAASPDSPAAAATGALADDPAAGGPRVWAAAFGAYGASDIVGNSYADTLGGLVVGAHAALTGNSTLGGVVSVARSEFATIGQGQTVDTTTGAVGLYGETRTGGLSLDYALLAGVAAQHSNRQVAGLLGPETASADFASWFWSPEIGLAIPVLERQAASAGAGLKVRYVGGATAAYAETGSSADLSVPQQGINILEARAELTGEFEASATENGAAVLTAKAGVLAQSNLGGATLALGLPGGGTVNSVTAGTVATGIYADLGLEAPLGAGASAIAGLGGELRSDGFRTVYRQGGALRQPLAAADIGHRRRHHRHELHVRLERQLRHVDEAVDHVLHVEGRLRQHRAVGLQRPGRHVRGHVGGGVADVDLPAGDVEGPAVERNRLGQPGDGVLGGGVGGGAGAGHVGRDRAVVDDAAALRVLVAHDAEGLARHVEGAVEVDVDHVLPGGDVEVPEGNLRARNVPALLNTTSTRRSLPGEIREVAVHGPRIGHVAGRQVGGVGESGRFLQFRLAAAQDRHPVAGLAQPDGGGPPDARTRAGDDRDLAFAH